MLSIICTDHSLKYYIAYLGILSTYRDVDGYANSELLALTIFIILNIKFSLTSLNAAKPRIRVGHNKTSIELAPNSTTLTTGSSSGSDTKSSL